MGTVRIMAGDGALAARGAGLVLIAAVWASAGTPLLPPTVRDFQQNGTQPVGSPFPSETQIVDPIPTAQDGCFLCHAGLDDPSTTVKPFMWRGSMHAHAYRDPIFQAAFALANADTNGSAGAMCLRCHTPRAWMEGRATPPTGNTDGSMLFFSDRNEGVSCNVCHRMVDRDNVPAGSGDDMLIRDALAVNGLLPVDYGNAQIILDPMDVRRGPLNFTANEEPEPPHLWQYSGHHRTSDLCATCHEVSNPIFSRTGGPTPSPSDSYAVNAPDTAHPTQDKHDQFAEQRTYSEWLNSSFATTPGGLFIPDATNPLVNRFGGNRVMVSQCQDCHMPTTTGQACWEIFEPPVRPDLPEHSFVGANVFALDAIMHLHGPDGTNELDDDTLALMQRQRVATIENLEKATDMSLTQSAGQLTVRVTNQTGHKLLTGMPEGRRIWINVKFFNSIIPIGEHGAYNPVTAELSESDTKVYEQKLGVDAAMGALVNLPAGESFHLAFVNKVFKDNRIPPRGFTNAAYNAVQAGYVGYSYADGQYWDDTAYCIPTGATHAEVTVYYQTSSKEYIEFLRDSISPDPRGTDLYDAWVAVGKSAPVAMDHAMISLSPYAKGDVNNDGMTTFGDITTVLANWGVQGGGVLSGDANCDGVVSFGDITVILANWGDQA
ncbi:MAG: hypothetical protein JNK58_04610 [Phycisphaerae bacterium]|nr:hypothetical protein [Phycisphaerae bacterium]